MSEKRHTGGMFNMDAEGNVMFRLWAKTSSLRDRLRHEPKQRKSAGLRLVEPGEGSHPCHAAQSKNAPMGRFVWSG